MTTIINGTSTTPNITFNKTTNTITIKGKSIPFEPELFWPIYTHQFKTLSKTNKQLEIEIDLSYINANSIQYLVKIATIENTIITWICDEFDDDMIELGETLEYLSSTKFRYLITY